MRVTNDTLRQAFLDSLAAAQRRIVDTQQQVSTGKRVNTPSDDPVAAARIAQLDASIKRIAQYRDNATIARNQLGLEEQSLASAIDNLHRVSELAVQANNAPLSNSDRAAIAAELRQRRDALRSIANTTDANGKYIFAGYSEDSQPFSVGSGGDVVYNGDQGQRALQISDTRHVAINDSGAQVFQRIPTGNGTFTLAAGAGNTGTGVLGAGTVTSAAAWVRDTYTITFVTPTSYEVRNSASTLVGGGSFAPGQAVTFAGVAVPVDGNPAAGDTFTVTPSAARDVFATLDSLITALETPAGDDAALAKMHNQVGQLLGDVDQAAGHIIDARSEVGSRLRALDDETSLGEDFELQLTQTLSDIRDLDYAEALSRLSQQLFGLDAAQKAYAQTQNLSLFRYL
jgi:flagellar hook-associated protein 3 FlgL